MLSDSMPTPHVLFCIFFFLFALGATPALAQSAPSCSAIFSEAQIQSDLPTLDQASLKDSRFGFLVPNERNTELLKPLLQNAIPGIYVTVGTERGWMGTAMAGPKIKALVQTDVLPRVVLYDRINAALLSLPLNRQQYYLLRTQGNFAQLQSELRKAHSLAAQDLALLKDPQTWGWWVENVQKHEGWKEFHEHSTSAYREGNYLHDDELFAVVSQLAKDKRVFVYQENIASLSLQQRLQAVAKSTGSKISVLDLSNAWEEGYLGVHSTTKLLQELAPLMKAETLVVFSYQARAQSENPGAETVFKYFVIRYGSIQSAESLQSQLGGLLLQDPSRQSLSRSRVNRFEF